MSQLKEFLQSEAERRRQRHAESRQQLQDWIMAVRDLTIQMKAWADESNKDAQVLQTEFEMVQLAEEGLGTYNAQSLVITLDPRKVRVTPIARNVVGGVDAAGIYIRADGRVDITDGARKYILYRIASSNSWKVVDTDNYAVRDFDREEFENILQSLLA